MKILLTGSRGSLGSMLKILFEKEGKHELLCPPREELELTDFNAVNKYFDLNEPDLIIHAAGRSGWRTEITDNSTFFENIISFDVLCRTKRFDTKLINFGTGAEFSREININNKERKVPASDFYGASKRIISSLSSSYSGVYQLRLYGCFGESESPERFIKANILNYINHRPIQIFQDRRFSYFYIKDLFKIINEIINNRVGYNRFDCVYSEEKSLLDIANIINSLDFYRTDINLENKEQGWDYIGTGFYEHYFDNITIEEKFNLIGLEAGIKEMYSVIKNG